VRPGFGRLVAWKGEIIHIKLVEACRPWVDAHAKRSSEANLSISLLHELWTEPPPTRLLGIASFSRVGRWWCYVPSPPPWGLGGIVFEAFARHEGQQIHLMMVKGGWGRGRAFIIRAAHSRTLLGMVLHVRDIPFVSCTNRLYRFRPFR
jgi:hypothetical protein